MLLVSPTPEKQMRLQTRDALILAQRVEATMLNQRHPLIDELMANTREIIDAIQTELDKENAARKNSAVNMERVLSPELTAEEEEAVIDAAQRVGLNYSGDVIYGPRLYWGEFDKLNIACDRLWATPPAEKPFCRAYIGRTQGLIFKRDGQYYDEEGRLVYPKSRYNHVTNWTREKSEAGVGLARERYGLELESEVN